MLKRLLLALCAALPVVLSIDGPAVAQPYPSKPIRLVVGYSPGGGNDLIARIVATRLQSKLNQPVIVENKPGAQSIVAAELVAKAAPDGYTLLVAPSGPMTINPAVYSKLPYDPLKDFVPVTMLAEFPLLLVVGADQPVKSVKELVEYGRANPKLANYASSATPFQLASELFNARTGSKFQHIPYKGSGDAVQAVMAGQVLMALAELRPDRGTIKGRQAAGVGGDDGAPAAGFPRRADDGRSRRPRHGDRAVDRAGGAGRHPAADRGVPAGCHRRHSRGARDAHRVRHHLGRRARHVVEGFRRRDRTRYGALEAGRRIGQHQARLRQ